jgi:hypothetical protein
LQRAGEGPERLDTRHHIDQVSKYKYLGVVYQEDGSWQAHAQKALKDASSLWVLEATAVMQQSADRSTVLMVQTFISSMNHVAQGHDEAVKDKMSAVVKKALRILALHPETPLLTFCTGTLGYFHPVYSLMLPNCVGSTDARTWRLADGPRRRCDSHSRVAVVSAGLR